MLEEELDAKYKDVLDEWFKSSRYIILHIWVQGVLNQGKLVVCLCDNELYFIRLSPHVIDCDIMLSVHGQKNLGEIDLSYFEPMQFPEI